MFKATFCSLALTALTATSATAKMSVNKAQECQAMLDFTSDRIGDVKKYDKKDVKMIQSGLKTYNTFLQTDYITPGLNAFTGGDKAKTQDYQKQIDAYKIKIVTGLNKRHPQERIFMDQVIAINGCYTEAPMSAAGTERMKETLMALMALAQQE